MISHMKNKIVSTEAFWDLMCKATFIRIDYHHGSIGDTCYEVLIPPEETDIPQQALDYLIEFSKHSLWTRILKRIGL